MTRKAKKRATTAGAVLLMLGVLHLGSKDASANTFTEGVAASESRSLSGSRASAQTICWDPTNPSAPPIACDAPSTSTPLATFPPAKPHVTAPPYTGPQVATTVVTTVPVGPVDPPAPPVVAGTNVVNSVVNSPPKQSTQRSGQRSGQQTAQTLPTTGNDDVLMALGGVGAAMLVAGTFLVVALPRRRKTIVIDLELSEG